MAVHATAEYGRWSLIVAAALGVVTSLLDYLTPETGIDGSPGALLTVISTVLLLLAAAAIMFNILRGWARSVLQVLIVLDIVGTAIAAYMLEAYVLLFLMALALIAWLIAAAGGSRPRRALSVGAAS